MFGGLLPYLLLAPATVFLLVFFVLFLVVRGVPALLLYRDLFDRRDRVALAFFVSRILSSSFKIELFGEEILRVESGRPPGGNPARRGGDTLARGAL